MAYELVRNKDDGSVMGVNDALGFHPADALNPKWLEFLKVNSASQTPLDLSPKMPDPIPDNQDTVILKESLSQKDLPSWAGVLIRRSLGV